MVYREAIIIAIFYILDIVVLIIEIVSTIDIELIVEFVFAIVVLIAGIVFIKDILIIFKSVVVVLIVKFVLAEVLFVNIKTN